MIFKIEFTLFFFFFLVGFDDENVQSKFDLKLNSQYLLLIGSFYNCFFFQQLLRGYKLKLKYASWKWKKKNQVYTKERNDFIRHLRAKQQILKLKHWNPAYFFEYNECANVKTERKCVYKVFCKKGCNYYYSADFKAPIIGRNSDEFQFSPCSGVKIK